MCGCNSVSVWMQVGKFVAMLGCQYANMQVCEDLRMQACKYVSVWRCEYASMQNVIVWRCENISMQVCGCVAMWESKEASMLVCDGVRIQVCNHRSVRQCEDEIMWVCGCKYVSVWWCGDASMQGCEGRLGLAEGGSRGERQPSPSPWKYCSVWMRRDGGWRICSIVEEQILSIAGLITYLVEEEKSTRGQEDWRTRGLEDKRTGGLEIL